MQERKFLSFIKLKQQKTLLNEDSYDQESQNGGGGGGGQNSSPDRKPLLDEIKRRATILGI
jgi:hypothetical protein